MHTHHKYALEIRTEDEIFVGTRIVDPNWNAAVECARFEWWRKSRELESGYDREVAIEPTPDPRKGLPAASGFRVRATDVRGSGTPDPVEFPQSYFNCEARTVADVMVGEGLLEKGQLYRFSVFAFPESEPRPTPGNQSPGYTVEEVVDRLPTPEPAVFDEFTAGSRREGGEWGEHFPIFLPQRILDEVDHLTELAGAVETGGVLIGRLLRDTGNPELALDITAQIPARKAEGSAHKLTFSADSWVEVRGVIALRRSDEVMLGWWHSHPAKAWCNPNCTPEQRRNCPLALEFFSRDDIQLHQTIFDRAYHSALVVTHTQTGMKHAVFGWHQGAVSQRDFTVTSPTGSLAGVGEPITH